MLDGKASCSSCPHPLSEHAEIEGMENRGHCKVPGCGCGAYSPPSGEEPAAPTSDAPAFHTLIGRATDAEGSQGIELRQTKMPGRPIDCTEEDFNEFGREVWQHYRNIFGLDPKHTGVSAIPYLNTADQPPSEVEEGKPMIHLSEGATPKDVTEALDWMEKSQLPLDQLGPSERLAMATKDISAEIAAEALKGTFADKASQEALAAKLTGMENPEAHLLAARIRQGEFAAEEKRA